MTSTSTNVWICYGMSENRQLVLPSKSENIPVETSEYQKNRSLKARIIRSPQLPSRQCAASTFHIFRPSYKWASPVSPSPAPCQSGGRRPSDSVGPTEHRQRQNQTPISMSSWELIQGTLCKTLFAWGSPSLLCFEAHGYRKTSVFCLTCLQQTMLVN